MSQRKRIAGLAFVALLSLGLAVTSPASAAVAVPAASATAVEPAAPAAAPVAPTAPTAVALPQQNPKPLFMSTFECNCQVFDGCTSSWWYDSTICQTGQHCYCQYQGIDYPDGYTCYSSLTATCI